MLIGSYYWFNLLTAQYDELKLSKLIIKSLCPNEGPEFISCRTDLV